MSYLESIFPSDSASAQVLGTAAKYREEKDRADAWQADSDRLKALEAELADIRKQKAAFDPEEEMGWFKFVYDADPSTYTSYRQNKRSAAQTEAIRKANEEATKASNAQTAWRQLLIDEETEKYKKIDAEREARKALEAGDKDTYEKMMDQVTRSDAALRRYAREKEQYRTKFNKMLGISEGEQEQSGEAGAPVYDRNADPNYKKVEDYGNLLNDIDAQMLNVTTRYASMKDPEKATAIQNATKKLAEFKNADVSFLSPAQKTAYQQKVRDLENAIPKFKKEQRTPMTKEKYEQALQGLNPTQIIAKGVSWLASAKKAGVQGLDQYIKEASANKGK